MSVAEGEGFEPSRRCYRLRDFQSRALGQAMRPFQIGHSVFGYQLSDNLRRCVIGTWLIADSQEPIAHCGGEGGIRTHGGSSPHRFSRAAPSTTRTPLQTREVYQRRPDDTSKQAIRGHQDRPAITGRRVVGTPGRIRTCGLWVRNPTLYPLSYRHVTRQV